MLGKRTRTADSTPPSPSNKRALTEYLPAVKGPSSPVTAAKRSAPLERSLSQKENAHVVQLVQPAFDDVFMADEDEEQRPSDFALPTPPLASEFQHVPDAPAPAVVDEPTTTRGFSNVYTHAASLLSPSLSTGVLSLLGRADQRDTLLAFLSRRLPTAYAALGEPGPSAAATSKRGPGPAAMYVSGPPGIGKTALVGAVVDELRARIDERELGGEVRLAMENCATIAAGGTGGERAWTRLGAALGVDMEDGEAALKAKERFEEGLKDGRKYLLILDEIDHLVASSSPSTRLPSSQQPDLLNALFALASVPASPLTLIGIANDLTLKALSFTPVPSPMSKGKATAKVDPLLTPVKPVRLHFKPYSWQELVAIVQQRLSLLAPTYPYLDGAPSVVHLAAAAAIDDEATSAKKAPVPLIDKPALDRCAKKVATGTGDVRTMLDVVRRAIAAAQAQALAAGPVDLGALTPASAPRAGMKHVSAALASSSGLTAAPSLAARLAALQGGPHQRFVLVSTLIALSRLNPAPPSSSSSSSSSTASRGSGCAGLDRPSSAFEAARVTADAAFAVYRDLVLRDEVLAPSALDQAAFVETLGMVEDLGGFVVVRGRPGSSPSSSPSKKQPGSGSASGGRARIVTPTKLKRGEKGRLTVELAHTAPMADLVAALTQAPAAGRESDEDEAARRARRALERERNDQRWRVKRAQLGRDEERRAEEELEGRDWERALLAREEASGKV
ncbi:hypothetical protein JCM3775_001511 [Rhodotorula graminis]